MSIETMTDRSLPLATRVNAAYLVGIQVADGDENGPSARAALDALRADIAACERLARAVVSADDAYKRWADADLDTEGRLFEESEAADAEHDATLAAYRKAVANG